MSKKIMMVILIIFTKFFSSTICFKCGTDLIKREPVLMNNLKPNNKRRLANEYTPIKIKYDYSQLIEQDYLSGNDLNDLINLFSEVGESFRSLLSIVHEDILVDTDDLKNHCEIDTYSSDIYKSLITHDILIFPVINTEMDEYTMAQSWVCLYANNFRPTVGVVEINPNFSLYQIDAAYSMKYLLLHEISHILGFTGFVFRNLNFIYSETINGEEIFYINSTKVIEKAKIHFNCENIKGIVLENQGGDGSAGSHWEARYMLGDYMISTDYPEVVISDITLAYF